MTEDRSVDELVSALNSLGAHFVAGGAIATPPELTPARLLAALAEQSDARLRLAIVALLLRRPDLANAAQEAIVRLAEPARTMLKLYYTAAMLLQQKHAGQLYRLIGPRESLPDLFSGELGIPTSGSIEARLQALGKRHRDLSGLAANWVGTYEHAAERLFKRMEHEATILSF